MIKNHALVVLFRPVIALSAALVLVIASCGRGGGGRSAFDPPQITIGERLFKETRFAQFFASMSPADVNASGVPGDPVVDTTETTQSSLPGPFAGKSINCSACHLVDQQLKVPGAGMRTYSDFARRSPIPFRNDSKTRAPRNSPPLVDASVERDVPLLLHFDGEFASLRDLIISTLTGRNYGWLPIEFNSAKAHIARVIREDNGNNALASQFGKLSYRKTLMPDSGVPESLRLPKTFQLDVNAASDDEILDAVANLIAAYLKSLQFARDGIRDFKGSPYDLFIAFNYLPKHPKPGESTLEYSRRLRFELLKLKQIRFVTPEDGGAFEFHEQPFVFGQTELNGLKAFLAEPASTSLTPAELLSGATGNCIACHPAPNFSDFRIHNIGTTQQEYDNFHGAGQFMSLSVPSLAARNTNPELYLPATPTLPNGTGVFRSEPDPNFPERADLGVWNVFANADFPAPQPALTQLIAEANGLDPQSTSNETLLGHSIALFKTPSLRDLGHGGPYMHSGQFDTLASVLQHYATFSNLARGNLVRNSDPRLLNISISQATVSNLVAFLKALNEDYE